ncbi:MAG: type II secretion system protein N [Rhodospirillaceae bacterium]|nr:type II secretion system protein N [Rhodospirillaceae bacterium]
MTLAQLGGLFGAALAAFMIAMAPASMLLSMTSPDRFGIVHGRVDGRLWHAEVKDVYWRDGALGDITIRLQPASLLLGRLAAQFDASGANATARGTLSRSLGSTTIIRDTNIALEVAGLPTLFSMAGQVQAEIDHLEYAPDGCVAVTARVATDALTRGIAGLAWSGPPLSGDARCADGALVVSLTGMDDMQQVTIDLVLKPDRSYQTRIGVTSRDASLAQLLPTLGFKREGDKLILVQEGTWG